MMTSNCRFSPEDYCADVRPICMTKRQHRYLLIKRLIDFFLALAATIVAFVPCILIAVAVKLDSPGPVFFKQKRIGKGGVEFDCYKFRTMKMTANHTIAPYSYANLDRDVTRVGRILRRTSIDEIPQLLCILMGKMSLIGYRPAQRSEIALNEVREGFDLYQILPGLTGWAQINGRDELAAIPELKAKYDAYYLQNFGFGMDFQILLRSVVNVLIQKDVRIGRTIHFGAKEK